MNNKVFMNFDTAIIDSLGKFHNEIKESKTYLKKSESGQWEVVKKNQNPPGHLLDLFQTIGKDLNLEAKSLSLDSLKSIQTTVNILQERYEKKVNNTLFSIFYMQRIQSTRSEYAKIIQRINSWKKQEEFLEKIGSQKPDFDSTNQFLDHYYELISSGQTKVAGYLLIQAKKLPLFTVAPSIERLNGLYRLHNSLCQSDSMPLIKEFLSTKKNLEICLKKSNTDNFMLTLFNMHSKFEKLQKGSRKPDGKKVIDYLLASDQWLQGFQNDTWQKNLKDPMLSDETLLFGDWDLKIRLLTQKNISTKDLSAVSDEDFRSVLCNYCESSTGPLKLKLSSQQLSVLTDIQKDDSTIDFSRLMILKIAGSSLTAFQDLNILSLVENTTASFIFESLTEYHHSKIGYVDDQIRLSNFFNRLSFPSVKKVSFESSGLNSKSLSDLSVAFPSVEELILPQNGTLKPSDALHPFKKLNKVDLTGCSVELIYELLLAAPHCSEIILENTTVTIENLRNWIDSNLMSDVSHLNIKGTDITNGQKMFTLLEKLPLLETFRLPKVSFCKLPTSFSRDIVRECCAFTAFKYEELDPRDPLIMELNVLIRRKLYDRKSQKFLLKIHEIPHIEDLLWLNNWKKSIRIINGNNLPLSYQSRLTDDDLYSQISICTANTLSLSLDFCTGLTSQGLNTILVTSISKIKSLSLFGCMQIDDKAFENIDLSTLSFLDLRKTSVSAQFVMDIRKKHPSLRVIYEPFTLESKKLFLESSGGDTTFTVEGQNMVHPTN